MPVDFRPTEGHIVSQAFDEAQSLKANELGTVAQFRDVGSTDYGSAFFKYVKYDTGTGPVAALANYVAYYYLVTGYKRSEVSMDRTDATPALGAGVLHSAPTNGQYIWIQVTGVATLGIALTAGADGNALTAVGAGADGTLDVSNAVTDQICAVATDISAYEIICMFPI
tara:strand:- start:716 stop:1222 length:507 start_codon:yes stop_codon:yes gene_type:complete